MFLRKAKAGADSFGHVWDADGAVVEVEDWQAVELLAIRDAGFTIADTPSQKTKPVLEPAAADETPVTEPAPPADSPVDETPPAKPRARKATKAAPAQE